MSSSVLTFNCSVSGNKDYLQTLQLPIQIMPQTLKIPTDAFIKTFPHMSAATSIYANSATATAANTTKVSNEITADCKATTVITATTAKVGNTQSDDFNRFHSVIHTSYITTPFISIASEDRWNQAIYNLRQYCKLNKRLGFKYLLVHLPRNEKELLNLANGMLILSSMCNAYSFVTLLLEIPYISCCDRSDSLTYLRNYFVNVIQFFDKFTNNNVQLCFDTAHLYSNGLDGDAIISLMETPINALLHDAERNDSFQQTKDATKDATTNSSAFIQMDATTVANKRNDAETAISSTETAISSTDANKRDDAKTTNSSTKLIDLATVIHLNGNERPKYTSDRHVPIYSERNKMKHWDDLVKYLANKHKILIAENSTHHGNYSDWEQFAEEFGLRIIENIDYAAT